MLIEIAMRVRRILGQISPDVLDRFSQSFHQMKVLYVPMMDLHLIFQSVKGRCHGNLIMKANLYYVHSLHVCQMVARFRFAITCY